MAIIISAFISAMLKKGQAIVTALFLSQNMTSLLAVIESPQKLTAVQ
jgi:hypothetical protein